jgi:hypothetical protein
LAEATFGNRCWRSEPAAVKDMLDDAATENRAAIGPQIKCTASFCPTQTDI